MGQLFGYQGSVVFDNQLDAGSLVWSRIIGFINMMRDWDTITSLRKKKFLSYHFELMTSNWQEDGRRIFDF